MRHPVRTAGTANFAVRVAGVCLVLPLGAGAQSWTLQRSVETSLESNDNYALSTTPGKRVNTLSLSGAFGAARQTESSATRVDLGLTGVKASGVEGQDRVDGRLNLGQTFTAPLDSFSLGLNAAQDQTFNTTRTTSDVALGRGRRRNGAASAGWSHSFTERFSASLQGSASRTTYAQELLDASNFQNTGMSGSLQYRLSETDSLSLQVGNSRFRTLNDTTRSSTVDASVGWTRALSELGSASFSIGRSSTDSTSLQPVLACPLQFSLCAAGLLPFIVVQRSGDTRRSSLQFSASYRQRLAETSDLSFSASRQQSPSGVGVVVLNESVTASLGQSFTPEMSGSLGYTEGRTVFQGVDAGPKPRSQTLSAGLSRALAPQLSVNAGYRLSRSSESRSGSSATANIVNASLKYEWPRIEVGR